MSISDSTVQTAKTALMGAAGGAIVLAIVGFQYGGWYTHNQANVMANQKADQAVVKALAPICAATFAKTASDEQKARFASATSDYDRGDIVSASVKLAGLGTMDYSLKNACVDAMKSPPKT